MKQQLQKREEIFCFHFKLTGSFPGQENSIDKKVMNQNTGIHIQKVKEQGKRWSHVCVFKGKIDNEVKMYY